MLNKVGDYNIKQRLVTNNLSYKHYIVAVDSAIEYGMRSWEFYNRGDMTNALGYEGMSQALATFSISIALNDNISRII